MSHKEAHKAQSYFLSSSYCCAFSWLTPPAQSLGSGFMGLDVIPFSFCRDACSVRASLAIVGDSNIVIGDNSTSMIFRTWETTCVARIESPPKQKKSS